MISPRCTTLGSATWELSSSSVMWSRQRSVFPGGTSVSKTLKSSVKLGVGPQLDSAATPRFVRRGGKSSELQWKRVLLSICLCHLWPITSQESCSCSAPFDLAWPPAPAAGVQTSRFAFKQTRREFIWYGGEKRRVKERNVFFLFCHIRHWHMYQLMTCGFTLWERAFLFSTTSERCCFIRLAASIQAVPLSRPVHSLLPEESSLVCVSFVCFVHFELIIIWLRLLARLSMFSFRLSRADDFCRWSLALRTIQQRHERRPTESVPPRIRPAAFSALVTWTDGAAQHNDNELCLNITRSLCCEALRNRTCKGGRKKKAIIVN